jgi:hypothetical protein
MNPRRPGVTTVQNGSMPTAAERDYQRDRYRRRRGLPVDQPDAPKLNVVAAQPVPPHDGSVVSAVRAELDSSPGAVERPGLSAVVLALAAILDDTRHVATQPGAAKVLASLMDKLHQAGTRGRRGHLATVRAMTDQRNA